MSINTRNIMRIWHSLINIVDRIEICVPMVSIAQFSSSKNIRCVHTVKNEEHQRCIYQPDNPLTVFFRKADNSQAVYPLLQLQKWEFIFF